MDAPSTSASPEKSPRDASSVPSACQHKEHYEFLGGAVDLHRGDNATIEGVGTFTLKEAHSDIVWFTPNPGKATFCFDPDPTFTVRDEP